MRSHVKASTAGSTQRQAGSARPGLISLACLAAISLLTLLAGATPALGAVVTDRPLLFSFDGSDSTAGNFGIARRVAIDDETGYVYVLDGGDGGGKDVVGKFLPDGTAANFSSIGASSLDGSATPEEPFKPENGFGFNFHSRISVDNSGGPNQGRLYLSRGGGAINAFDLTGNYLWQIPRSFFKDDQGTAVDTEGHIWVTNWFGQSILEFANTGSPPAQISSFGTAPIRPRRIAIDANGNLYVARDGGGVDKYVGGINSGSLDPTSTEDVAVDQSSATGHVFTLHTGTFNEYDSTGALVGSFGTGAIGQGRGVAYNNTLDRVYVADNKSVKVFGPEVTGTVPDVTIEAASELGVSKAKLNGKVNPQSVANNYFFEWKEGTGASWSNAKSSAPQSLLEDSSDHAVSFNVTGLKGNTTYQVRLIALNTANGLRSTSAPANFTTNAAAAAPAITIATPTTTPTTAAVSGTVNPQEDFNTTWRLQTSTDPACASGFTNRPLHNLESEATSAVAVAEELTGLLPSAHYCVRITATNSFGSATSETKEFTTDAIVPSQVSTAFAAPRTDNNGPDQRPRRPRGFASYLQLRIQQRRRRHLDRPARRRRHE